jgi:predicted transposase/invertase (TIGR01784 family)
MQFDTTLKDLFLAKPHSLIEQLTGGQIETWLMSEQPSVKLRRIDLVARLTDGRILHVELQVDDDPSMPWRMLEYYAPLRLTYEQEPWQIVLYVGTGRPQRMVQLREKRLRFSYDVVDIRHLNAEPLLESDQLSDNLLAILCNVKDVRAVSRRILQKLRALPMKQAKDAALKLTILSKLRRADKIVIQEVEKVITITREDLMEWPMISEVLRSGEQEAEARGEKKGERKGERKGQRKEALKLLSKQLTQRFGALPDWAEIKLAEATLPTLERWSLQLLTAKSLKEALK